jgi:hypothetical protein
MIPTFLKGEEENPIKKPCDFKLVAGNTAFECQTCGKETKNRNVTFEECEIKFDKVEKKEQPFEGQFKVVRARKKKKFEYKMNKLIKEGWLIYDIKFEDSVLSDRYIAFMCFGEIKETF